MATEAPVEAPPLTTLYVKLLKGPLSSDQHANLWSTLLLNKSLVQGYFDQIGLEVYVNEDDGFAFLRQREPSEDEDFPRLVSRRSLSFHVSVLAALLRKNLLEFDTNQAGSRAIVEREEIYKMMAVFMPQTTNEKTLRSDVNGILSKVEDLGIIAWVPEQDDKIEIKRVIKALVNGEWLSNLNKTLEQYREHASAEH